MKIIASLIIIFALCTCAWAENTNDSHVVLIVAGNISIRDIADPTLPNLSKLLQNGSGGLMNVRVGKPSRDAEPALMPGMEMGCASIGSGAMATGGAELRRAYNSTGMVNGLRADDLYHSRTGESFGSAQVLHTEIVKIKRINESASYRAKPGELGSILHKAGIKTAILGNSDLPDEIHREAVAIVMDNAGVVDYGDVSSQGLIKLDGDAPYGLRTNTNTLLKKLDEVLSESRFIVIDFGDTFRADRYAEYCTDEKAIANRHQAAIRLDRFVAQVLGKLDTDRDTVILLSPNARIFSEIEDERLTSIIIKGPGFQSGMLISPSTRKAGVVTITDITPTVLGMFNINPSADMVGRPIKTVSHNDAAETLLNINLNASNHAQRLVAMRGTSVAQSVVVVLVSFGVILGVNGVMKKITEWLVLIPAVLPLVMLYSPLLYSGGLIGSVLILIALTIAVLAISVRVFNSLPKAFVWLCGINVLSLAIDMVRGAPLTGMSIAGYGMVEGARYYGIGNELMGTMLGAVIISLGMVLSSSEINKKLKTIIAAIAFLIVFLIIGMSNLGANVGGAMAAAPAMAVVLLVRRERGWRLSMRSIALILVALIIGVGGLFAIDALRGSTSQSHAGRIVGLATGGDSLGVLMVLQRKVALNFMLLSTSLWSRLLGLSLASSIVLFWLGIRKFGKEFLDREETAAALGCSFGVIGAFIFNDSGVVAAATCAVFLWMFLAIEMLVPHGLKKPRG